MRLKIAGMFVLLVIGIVILKVVWNWFFTKPPEDQAVRSFLKEHHSPPAGIAVFAAMAAASYDENKSDNKKINDLKDWHRIPDMRKDEKSGLAFAVFTHYLDEQDHWLVVFAFRGTEADDMRDWRANFRDIRPKNTRGSEDQYVAGATRILRQVDWVYDEFGPQAAYYAVGHSLGGGLAKLAGHLHPWISNVYVFNSSPVTGWDISLDETEASLERQPFNVVAIYERGEILEYVRNAYSMVSSIPKDVKYSEFVVDYTAGQPILQHNMWILAEGLHQDSQRLGIY